MIVSFADRATGRIFHDEWVGKLPPPILKVARRKLLMLHAAASLDDLRVPPGNRLEKLGGDRYGQYSIRINDQWRICFAFANGQASEVEIVDYHC